jgi:hypothetical protein
MQGLDRKLRAFFRGAMFCKVCYLLRGLISDILHLLLITHWLGQPVYVVNLNVSLRTRRINCFIIGAVRKVN